MVTETLRTLFDAARERGGLDFIFTLLRVEGMSLDCFDPLERLRQALNDPAAHQRYWSLAANEQPLKLLANLVYCSSRESFDPFALNSGSLEERVTALLASAREKGHPALADALALAYADLPPDEDDAVASHEAPQHLRSFLLALLATYDDARKAFVGQPRLHKLPRFDVLELLVDDEVGLHGFRVHFSNGEHAEFLRTRMETRPLNLVFENGITFFVGNTDALTSEWRVGGVPLYEVGLPGRYNPPGEWRPLVYPGSWDAYTEKARVASDRSEVQGRSSTCS